MYLFLKNRCGQNANSGTILLLVMLQSSTSKEDGDSRRSVYPPRRNYYNNNSRNMLFCNCLGAITEFSCRAPENNSKLFFLPVIILKRRVCSVSHQGRLEMKDD